MTAAPGGAAVQVRVIPRAGRSELAGLRGGALLVRIAAAPVEGGANEAVIDFLAGAFGLPRRFISILSGERSRDKRVLIAGLDADAARERIRALIGSKK